MHRYWLTALLSGGLVGPAMAQVLSDPGFEAIPVGTGMYVRPRTGVWMYENDAAIVRPYAPNTSLATFQTWSATFAPIEGEQYACTYAGGDRISQYVTFPHPGTFELAVWAAAPSGTLTDGDETRPLVQAAFRFVFSGIDAGPVFTLEPGTGWTRFSTMVEVTAPITLAVGVHNQYLASYFIHYDGFSVPAPSAIAALGVALLPCTRRRRQDFNRRCPSVFAQRTAPLLTDA